MFVDGKRVGCLWFIFIFLPTMFLDISGKHTSLIFRGIPERVHPFSQGVCRNVYNFCCSRSTVCSMEPLPTPQEIEEKSKPYTCLDVATCRCCWLFKYCINRRLFSRNSFILRTRKCANAPFAWTGRCPLKAICFLLLFILCPIFWKLMFQVWCTVSVLVCSFADGGFILYSSYICISGLLSNWLVSWNARNNNVFDLRAVEVQPCRSLLIFMKCWNNSEFIVQSDKRKTWRSWNACLEISQVAISVSLPWELIGSQIV